jgi:hypothetical protein
MLTSFKNTIIGLILLALAVAGAWSWYDSHLKSPSKDQTMETAERDVRDTAECHLEAFKLRPGLTETDVEIQAAFMGHLYGGTRIPVSSRLHRGTAQCRRHI